MGRTSSIVRLRLVRETTRPPFPRSACPTATACCTYGDVSVRPLPIRQDVYKIPLKPNVESSLLGLRKRWPTLESKVPDGTRGRFVRLALVGIDWVCDTRSLQKCK